MTTKTGKNIVAGDRVQMEDGSFRKIREIRRAPFKLQFADGAIQTPRWAYLDNGEHVTICADDQVTVA